MVDLGLAFGSVPRVRDVDGWMNTGDGLQGDERDGYGARDVSRLVEVEVEVEAGVVGGLVFIGMTREDVGWWDSDVCLERRFDGMRGSSVMSVK